MQGETITDIANRIAKQTGNTNEKAMVRYSRTVMTGAQNAGRIETMHKAQDMGISVKKQWLATLDRRTRDSHRHLDGQIKDVDEPFESDFGDIMFPGDPDAHPGDIYNCRCTLTYIYPDYQMRDTKRRDNETGEEIDDISYNEWLKERMKHEKPLNDHKTVDGKDISNTWRRREGQFEFDIEDVINAQGYDGIPRLVNKKEFEEASKKSNLIMQRAYTAPDQATLDRYQDMLYRGEWYVDCSNGGAALGKGMYAVYENGTAVTEYIGKQKRHLL